MASSAATFTLVSAGHLRWSPGHREQRAGARPEQRHGHALPAHLVRHARGLDDEGRIRQAVEHHHVAAPNRTSPGETPTPTSEAPSAEVVAAQRQHHTAIGLQLSDRVGQRPTTVDRQVGPDAGRRASAGRRRRQPCAGPAGGRRRARPHRGELVDHREHGREAVAVGQAEDLGTPRQPLRRTARHRGRPGGRAARPGRPPTPTAASRGAPAPGRRGCAGADAPRRGRSPRAARVAPPAARRSGAARPRRRRCRRCRGGAARGSR